MSFSRILSLLLLISFCLFIPGQLNTRAALHGAGSADQEGRSGARTWLPEKFQCSLFSRIKGYVELYAKSYEEPVIQIAHSTSPPYRCTWQ